VYFLARDLSERGHKVIVINREEARSRLLSRRLPKVTVVLGEGSDVQTLEEAGARRADMLLAMTPHDQDNLIACQIAQRSYQVPRTIAVVNDPANVEVFHKLGITVAFSTTRVIVGLIEQQVGLDAVNEVMSLAAGKLNIIDLRLHESSPAVGKTVQELGLSEKILIASIIRQEEVIIPRGGQELKADDHLILITPADTDSEDLYVLTGENGAGD
jgi:trk system potassium uptake protein TrkA